MKFAGKETLFTFSIAFVFAALFIVGCAPEKKYRVLSFFFDGVPDPNKKTEIVIPGASKDSLVVVKKDIKPEYYYHKPYEEDKCNQCHEGGFSNALIKPMPELCYTCHEDFNTKFKTMHGPVASGNCLTCHNQHMSKFEKLLERSGQQICFYCHNPVQVLSNKIHEHIENKNCTDCHNPHGGENRGLLITGICYDCHQNFSLKNKFLHGPVASGSCSSCHDSHSSVSPKHLLRSSQDLCLFCHNAEQVYNNPTHKKARKSDCTACHNPHGGEDRNFLQALINHTNVDSIGKVRPLNSIEKDSTLNNHPK